MTTLADVIQRCLHNHLLTGHRELRNTLSGAINASATTLTLNYAPDGISTGSKISIDLEDLYVVDVNPTARTVTVIRGQYGSTAASHSDAAVVMVNPKFSPFQIATETNNVLAELTTPGNNLFRPRTVTLTASATAVGYDMTSVTDDLGIIEVRYRVPGPEKAWPYVDRWEYAKDLPTTDFASGRALIIHEGGYPGQSIQVRYKAKFVSLANLADDVAGVAFLHAEAHDLLPLGAAIRLVTGREVKRNFDEVQGETRRAQEVPPGANLQSVRGLLAVYERRIAEEAERLATQYVRRDR
jgi:hypothetical protein